MLEIIISIVILTCATLVSFLWSVNDSEADSVNTVATNGFGGKGAVSSPVRAGGNGDILADAGEDKSKASQADPAGACKRNQNADMLQEKWADKQKSDAEDTANVAAVDATDDHIDDAKQVTAQAKGHETCGCHVNPAGDCVIAMNATPEAVAMDNKKDLYVARATDNGEPTFNGEQSAMPMTDHAADDHADANRCCMTQELAPSDGTPSVWSTQADHGSVGSDDMNVRQDCGHVDLLGLVTNLTPPSTASSECLRAGAMHGSSKDPLTYPEDHEKYDPRSNCSIVDIRKDIFAPFLGLSSSSSTASSEACYQADDKLTASGPGASRGDIGVPAVDVEDCMAVELSRRWSERSLASSISDESDAELGHSESLTKVVPDEPAKRHLVDNVKTEKTADVAQEDRDSEATETACYYRADCLLYGIRNLFIKPVSSVTILRSSIFMKWMSPYQAWLDWGVKVPRKKLICAE
eukprot:TRINITY_DN10574_c0_g1_i2.p1 TRINITY_DN10574_c0_g1~~TRINITY_DN10574_c0_g1_i2.p1  ORF type:complete len:467 (-),score=81.17 TRINITY_DN10574_c0_g1_i2:603-2003(-)